MWQSDRNNEDLSGYLGHHQPVSRGYGGIEERVGSPDVEDVVDATLGMLEEMGGLVIDLERCLVIEGIEVERRIHDLIVLQTRTQRTRTRLGASSTRTRPRFDRVHDGQTWPMKLPYS